MRKNETKQPMTDEEKLIRRQKRAKYDGATAVRHMTEADLAEHARMVLDRLGVVVPEALIERS